MPKETKQIQKENIERTPVVVIVGHIDHGKSTLLDYIRKTNVVKGEAGGITQHIAAYEVLHKDENGLEKRITFLDTPGHEAFSMMRIRGCRVADVAVLVISADDGVKEQTLETISAIKECGIPFIVAINKIDKPDANPEQVRNQLMEHEVYLEGYGGSVPVVEISAKEGTGISDLLGIILLVSDLEELKGDTNNLAEGIVIESKRDPKRGVAATLIIKNGTLKSGQYIVAGNAIAPVRIFEDYKGKTLKEASFSSPVLVVGFSEMPSAGTHFVAVENKKEAEKLQGIYKNKEISEISDSSVNDEIYQLPIVIKADVAGSLEAVLEKVRALSNPSAQFKFTGTGIGAINESDVKLAQADPTTIIVGFHVNVDVNAKDMNENVHATIETFDIIYKLIEWLEEELEKRRPKTQAPEITGALKVLAVFSKTKERSVIGGRVTEGELLKGSRVKIMRRDNEIGEGKVINLERGKSKADKVEIDEECGLLVESRMEIATGDVLNAFKMISV